jgi:phage baseplate assembly protein W
MFPAFINIPVQFGDITQKADTRRISLKDSIHAMIHLIATTSYGEVKQDPYLGCDIWSYDFENIYNPHSFKEELKKSIQNSIKVNEKRLINISVDIQVEQMEVKTKIKNRRIKTRVFLNVNGVIGKTNEPFYHQEYFFIGPLSYY